MTHYGYDQATPTPPLAPSSEDRTYGMLTWGLNFFFPVIGPLILMLVQKSPFAQAASKEAINFGLSYFVYSVVAAVLTIVLVGFLLAAVVGVAFVVFSILGLVAANEGRVYRVPGIFRLVK